MTSQTLRIGAFVAALLSTLIVAHAASRVVTLRNPALVADEIAAMPVIEAPADDAERQINAAVGRFNFNARKAAAQCKKDSRGRYHWSRSVNATMRGPGFLSFTITDDTYCGTAYPNMSAQSIVYDLSTGKPVDWTKLLPPSLTGKVTLQTGMDGTKTVALSSQRLYDLYLKLYRHEPKDPDETGDEKECREAVMQEGASAPPAMSVWLDAKAGGLAIQFDLAHVVQACADAVVIPVQTLKAEGAKAALTDALEAARQASQ